MSTRWLYLSLILVFSLTQAQFGGMDVLKQGEGELKQKDVEETLKLVRGIKRDAGEATNQLDVIRTQLFQMVADDAQKTAVAEAEPEKQEAMMLQGLADLQAAGKMREVELAESDSETLQKMIHNLNLAIKKDQKVVKNVPKARESSEKVLEAAQKDKVAAAKMSSQLEEISTAATSELPAIAAELPGQIEALQSLLLAAMDIAGNNSLSDLPIPSLEDVYKQF
jgi:uncharacterized protein (UPF0147 family)